MNLVLGIYALWIRVRWYCRMAALTPDAGVYSPQGYNAKECNSIHLEWDEFAEVIITIIPQAARSK
jgi:predicted DNA-binding protein (UPF0251 family)